MPETTKNNDIDWLSHASDNIHNAGMKRRNIIRATKWLLILTVIIICIALFYSFKEGDQTVPKLQDIKAEKTKKIESNNTLTKENTINKNNIEETAKGETAMLKAKYSGMDEEKRPFNISADKASKSSDTPDMINLEKPMADILLKDKSWVAVYGENGVYMQQHMQLFLNDKVKLFHDSGYEMITDNLHIDLKRSHIVSEQSVSGHGPFGTIKAKGLEFTTETNKLIFDGPVKLTLFSSEKNNLLQLGSGQ